MTPRGMRGVLEPKLLDLVLPVIIMQRQRYEAISAGTPLSKSPVVTASSLIRLCSL